MARVYKIMYMPNRIQFTNGPQCQCRTFILVPTSRPRPTQPSIPPCRQISTRFGWEHGRPQDFFPGVGKFIGIARFSLGCTFFSKKLTTFFSRRPQNTGHNY